MNIQSSYIIHLQNKTVCPYTRRNQQYKYFDRSSPCQGYHVVMDTSHSNPQQSYPAKVRVAKIQKLSSKLHPDFNYKRPSKIFNTNLRKFFLFELKSFQSKVIAIFGKKSCGR